MKCIDRTFRRRRKRIRQLRIRIALFFCSVIGIISFSILLLNSRRIVHAYVDDAYCETGYHAKLFADDLCVTNEEIEYEEFYRHDKFHGALLFNVDTQEVLYSENANKRLFPASTTKLMTAYLGLKYGELNDMVTVSKEAVDIPSDSSTAGLKEGDVLSMEDLLYSLMLASGNDSAIVIAEHISGNNEEFVKLMNDEAAALGASNTNFVNPHGYHNSKHYTTAYDLYLIFNECLKNETFVAIISSKSRQTIVTEKSGIAREVTWGQTNQFLNGMRDVPKGVTIVGGKTGNTNAAGSCLVQLGKDAEGTSYISIIMGATSMRNLYDNMTFLWMTLAD